jgi:hypothetical protein
MSLLKKNTNFLAFDEFMLRWILIHCPRRDRHSVTLVCRLWMRNAHFVAPEHTYMHLSKTTHPKITRQTRIEYMDRLWKFAGDLMRPTSNLLRAAAVNGRYEFIRNLVERGVTYDGDDCTVITEHIFENGDEMAVNYVINQFGITKYSLYPISETIGRNKNLAALRALLSNPRCRGIFYEKSLLIILSHHGMYSGVKLLLETKRFDEPEICNNALVAAVDHGHFAVVNLLLAHPNVDPAAHGSKALVNACNQSRWAILQRLLADGRADPMVTNSSVLNNATMFSRYNIVSLLLADGRADPSTHEHDTVFQMCAEGQTHIVRQLLNHPKVGKGLDLVSQTTYYFAYEHWQETKICCLTRAPSRLDNEFKIYNYLLAAVVCNQWDVVNLLLSEYPERFDPGSKNSAALRYACKLKHWRIVERLLVDKRCKPSVEDYYPLKQAISCHENVLASTMMKNITFNPAVHGNDMLEEACRVGNIGIVVTLMQRPLVNPSLKNNHVILTAIRNDFPSIAAYLIGDRRVDVTRTNFELLSVAIANDQPQVVDAVLRRNPDLKLFDRLQTSIYESFNYNNVAVASLLFAATCAQKIPIQDLPRLLFSVCRYHDCQLFGLICELPNIDLFDNDCEALKQALHYGNTIAVTRMLSDPRSLCVTDNDGQVLRCALAHYSETNVRTVMAHPVFFNIDAAVFAVNTLIMESGVVYAQLLLESPAVRARVNVYPHFTAMFRNNLTDMICLLLDHQLIDPSYSNDEGLMLAVRSNNIPLVERLLRDPRVNPTARGGFAMSLAIEQENHEIVDILKEAIRKRNRKRYEDEMNGRDCDAEHRDYDDEDLVQVAKKKKLI